MTRQTRRPIVTSLSAFALGLLPAFFVTVSVFSDAQWTERMMQAAPGDKDLQDQVLNELLSLTYPSTN